MEAFKFDEKIYVVGDAFILHRFIHVDGKEASKEDKIMGILTKYSPSLLTFMTINGPITYEATIHSDFKTYNPKTRIDTLGNKYDIVMSGLKANLDVIEQTFEPGTPYYVQTPDDWINVPCFHGIYSGYNEKDLWEWPELKFMSEKGEIRIRFVDILRGIVNVCEMYNQYIPIRFDDIGG